MQLIIYGISTLGILLIIGLAYFSNFIDNKDIATSALALVGTFFGATLAFRLNIKKEQDEVHRKRREAINRCLFVLVRQENAIKQMHKEYEKIPNLQIRAFNMPALKPPSYDDLTQNFSDLEFIIHEYDPNLLFKLAIEQERFAQTMVSIKARNDFYVDEVQKALSTTIQNGQVVTSELLLERLGQRVFHSAINYVTTASEMLALSIESNSEMKSEIRKLGKILYPKAKFISSENEA